MNYYVIYEGGCRIGIGYEYRDDYKHPVDNTRTRHVNLIANFVGINDVKQEKEYNMILGQVEKITDELNNLNEEISSLKTDLAISQTPALFDSVTSKRVIELQKELKEKDYEINHLVNSIYRKTDEFYEEKKILLNENNALKKENKQSIAMIEAVRKTELSKIPTSELAQELYSRMNDLDKLERSHSKLLGQHKKAAVMIAELKKQ